MKTVVIFGGAGFVGKHLIRILSKNGYKIIVPYQSSTNEAKLRLFGSSLGQIIPLKFNNIKERKIENLLKNADVVINLKTLWQGNQALYDKKIYEFNVYLTDLVNKFNNQKLLIFFSGIGINKNSSSERSKSIFKSEEYIKKNCCNSCIIKPSVIIGGGDPFITKMIPIFKYSYFIPIFGDGSSKFQPVYVDDIAEAINFIISNDLKGRNSFELFGPEIFTYKSIYLLISQYLGIKRIFLPIPFFLARIVVYFIQKLSINLITKEQLELFKNDNLPTNIDKNFLDLKIVPRDLKEIIKISIKKNI